MSDWINNTYQIDTTHTGSGGTQEVMDWKVREAWRRTFKVSGTEFRVRCFVHESREVAADQMWVNMEHRTRHRIWRYTLQRHVGGQPIGMLNGFPMVIKEAWITILPQDGGPLNPCFKSYADARAYIMP